MLTRVATLSECCSVKPGKRNARAHVAGTAMLTTARFDGFSVLGTLVHEAMESLEPTHPALFNRLVEVYYDHIAKRWLTVHESPGSVIDVTDGEFSVVYSYGGKMMVCL